MRAELRGRTDDGKREVGVRIGGERGSAACTLSGRVPASVTSIIRP
jgi:hypothetical protein